MTRTKHWPARRTRNGDALAVSDDRSTVFRLTPSADGGSYVSERLALDFDPTDGSTLVERDTFGRVVRLAAADSDEWMLTAEWDLDSRTEHDSYGAALEHVYETTDRTIT